MSEHEPVVRGHPVDRCFRCGISEKEARLGYSKFNNGWLCEKCASGGAPPEPPDERELIDAYRLAEEAVLKAGNWSFGSVGPAFRAGVQAVYRLGVAAALRASAPTPDEPNDAALIAASEMRHALHALRLEVDGKIVDDLHIKFEVYRAARGPLESYLRAGMSNAPAEPGAQACLDGCSILEKYLAPAFRKHVGGIVNDIGKAMYAVDRPRGDGAPPPWDDLEIVADAALQAYRLDADKYQDPDEGSAIDVVRKWLVGRPAPEGPSQP